MSICCVFDIPTINLYMLRKCEFLIRSGSSRDSTEGANDLFTGTCEWLDGGGELKLSRDFGWNPVDDEASGIMVVAVEAKVKSKRMTERSLKTLNCKLI